MKNFIFVVIGLIISFSQLLSVVRHVPSGTGNPSHATIELALAASSPGDIIQLNPTTQPYDQVARLGIPVNRTLRVQPGVIFNIISGITIDPGAFLETNGNSSTKVYFMFGSGAFMNVYGKVTCNHTIFSVYAAGVTWTGIYLMTRNADASLFNWCDVHNVYNSVAGAALAVHGAHDVTVKYCKVSNLSSLGTAGIYFNNTQSTRVYKNLVENNRMGVIAQGESYVSFGPITPIITISCDSGNNKVTGNSGDGLYASETSYMDLSSSYNKFNIISGNGNPSTGTYEAVTWGTAKISAAGNYWGTIPPNYLNDVVWNPPAPCTTPPPPPRLLVGIIADNNGISLTPNFKISNTASADDELLHRAFDLLSLKKYDEALPIFKSIVSTQKDNEFAYGLALAGISNICQTAKINEAIEDCKELLEYLKSCSEAEGALPIAKIVYANALSGTGHYDEAISEYETIAKSYHGTEHEIRALVEMAYTYLFYKKDLTKVSEIVDALDKIAKNDISVQFLKGKMYVEINNSNTDASKHLFETAMGIISIDIDPIERNKYLAESFRLLKLIIETPEFIYNDYYIHALARLPYFCSKALDAGEESELGDWRDIIEYIKAHTKDDPNVQFDLKCTYANALLRVDHYYEAIAEYEELFELATNDRERERVLFDLLMIYQYLSDNVKAAETSERIEKLKSGNSTTSVDNPTDLPTEYTLSQNYPNPFNPTTVIKYQIPEAAQVSLKVYDVMGREVATLVNGLQNSGSYDVTFDASGLASGIYFYKLNANGKQLINKMLLMK